MNATEAQSCLQGLAKSALSFAHVIAGINSGLFGAILRHGEHGVTPGALASEMGYFEDYVRVWCQTAFTLEFLEQADDGRLRVADGFAQLLHDQAPMLSVLRTQEIGLRERLEHPEFMRTGAVHSREEIEGIFRRIRADHPSRRAMEEQRDRDRIEHIYGALPEVRGRLEAGGRLLEVGCGTGRLLLLLAWEFPKTSFVGIDLEAQSLEHGRREIEAAGLGHRVELEQVGGQSLSFHEEFDLVSMNIVMHELLPELRAQVLGNVWRALRPGGILVSNDFYYPGRLEDFRRPEHQVAVFDQAMEVIWGNRHLSREQLAELLTASGFREIGFHVVEVLALGASGGRRTDLTTLALK